VQQAIGQEARQLLEVAGHSLERVIEIARDRVALDDLRETANLALQFALARGLLAVDRQAHERHHSVAQRLRIEQRGIADGSARIVVAAGNFAGRTTTIISFSSEAQYRSGFGPCTPGFDTVA